MYGAEVVPMALRSKVMGEYMRRDADLTLCLVADVLLPTGLAAASHFIVNVGITEAGPSAFANIRENYYYVFVACTSFFLVIAYFYFPEVRIR